MIATFTLDRPETRQAFDLETAKKLKIEMNQAIKSGALGFIIYSHDSQIFCSGGDLKQYAKLKTKSAGIKINREIAKILKSFGTMPLVVVCAVEGDCLGGGCELALACDWIIASEFSRFSWKQSHLGLTPGWGGASRLLSRLSGVALELLLSGRPISSFEAKSWGMIDEICLKSQAVSRAQEFLNQLFASHGQITGELITSLKKLMGGAPEQAVFEKLWYSKAHLRAIDLFLTRR